MTKNRTRTPVYLDPGMHPGLEVKGLKLPLAVKYFIVDIQPDRLYMTKKDILIYTINFELV